MLFYHHFQCPTNQSTELALEDTKLIVGHTNGNANTIAAATIVNAPTMSDPLQQVLERRGYPDKQEEIVTKYSKFLGFR
jgi:hypothetical protein